MPHFDDQNDEPRILHGVDHSIVSRANPIQLVGSAEFFRSLRTRAYRQRINLWLETMLDLRWQVPKLSVGLTRELNFVRHGLQAEVPLDFFPGNSALSFGMR